MSDELALDRLSAAEVRDDWKFGDSHARIMNISFGSSNKKFIAADVMLPNNLCMSGWADRLKAALLERGMTKAEVARSLSMSQERVGHYFAGTREPDYVTLTAICGCLGKTPNDILGASSGRIAPVEKITAPGIVEIGAIEYLALGKYEQRLSAGPGSLIEVNPEPLGYYLFEHQWLRALSTASPNDLAVLQVDGDSMLPLLQDKDWVLVDRTQQRLSREGIYAIRVGDSCWVKRLSFHPPSGKMRVISENPTIPMWEAGDEDFAMIGRVIWVVGRRL